MTAMALGGPGSVNKAISNAIFLYFSKYEKNLFVIYYSKSFLGNASFTHMKKCSYIQDIKIYLVLLIFRYRKM